MKTAQQAYQDGVDKALEKYASRGRQMARAWAQEAQNYHPGSPSHAKYLGLAARAGEASFAPTSRPTPLGRISAGGSEGPVHLNIQPQEGRATATAVKTVPTTSQWHNDALLERRQRMAQGGLNQSSAFAKLYDARKLPTGEHQYTSEYVPGQTLHTEGAAGNRDYMRTRLRASRDVRRVGKDIGLVNPASLFDARPGNMIRDARTGQPKIVDSFQLTSEPRPGTPAAAAGIPHEAETAHRWTEDFGKYRGVMRLPSNQTELTPAGRALALDSANQQGATPYQPKTYKHVKGDVDAYADHYEDMRRRVGLAPPLPAAPAQQAPPLPSSIPPPLSSAPAPAQPVTAAGPMRRRPAAAQP